MFVWIIYLSLKPKPKTMLPKKIQQQKALMEMALRRLNDIAVIERLVSPVDETMAKVMIEEQQKEYAEVLATLLENFSTVGA